MDNDPAKDEETAAEAHSEVRGRASTPSPEGLAAPRAPGLGNAPAAPFWTDRASVALVTGLLTAIPAVTVAWVTHLNNESQLQLALAQHHHQQELAEQEQEHRQRLAAQDQGHKIRMDYFSRAIDPANDADYRARVLRFLSLDHGDPALQDWADSELEAVNALMEARAAAAEAEAALADAQEDLARMEGENSAQRAAVETARADARRARAQLRLVQETPHPVAAPSVTARRAVEPTPTPVRECGGACALEEQRCQLTCARTGPIGLTPEPSSECSQACREIRAQCVRECSNQ